MAIVIAAAIVGLILGIALLPAGAVWALPIAALLVVVFGVTEFRRRSTQARSMQSFREEADSKPIEFTERDRQTLAD